ncbi:MAG TPA: Xaa-Pro peptidase family protein [Alphaproteobacteria bacterium]|nr:Xaa-Pro peptidase family protein [Alphaproteobacteria bacterium]
MTTAKLIFENGANWRYATGTAIADPALWYMAPGGQTHILVSDLELALMRQNAKADHVHSFAEAREKFPGQPLDMVTMVRFLVTQGSAPERIEVPASFPTGLFIQLQNAGLPLGGADSNPFFPTRGIKTAEEIAKLKAAQKLNEKCFKRAIAILKQSTIEADSTLAWRNKPLTSEILQTEMRIVALKGGATEFSGGPIVTCGLQATMPHEHGHGVLRAHELIIIDNYPRHPNGYWGDLTRTYIKGQPSAVQRQVYQTVLAAQQLALSMLKAKAEGMAVHTAVANHFAQAGFATGNKGGTPFGYFHGTGHSVGLELHDAGPRMLSTAPCELQAGYVTSVEPGLYYPPNTHPQFMGGCRIEDVVVITKSGHKNLTSLSKTDWIID